LPDDGSRAPSETQSVLTIKKQDNGTKSYTAYVCVYIHIYIYMVTEGDCMRIYTMYSPNTNPVIQSREIRWARHVERMEETGRFGGEPQGKIPLERPRHR
jgi:hypothetical protein